MTHAENDDNKRQKALTALENLANKLALPYFQQLEKLHEDIHIHLDDLENQLPDDPETAKTDVMPVIEQLASLQIFHMFIVDQINLVLNYAQLNAELVSAYVGALMLTPAGIDEASAMIVDAMYQRVMRSRDTEHTRS